MLKLNNIRLLSVVGAELLVFLCQSFLGLLGGRKGSWEVHQLATSKLRKKARVLSLCCFLGLNEQMYGWFSTLFLLSTKWTKEAAYSGKIK